MASEARLAFEHPSARSAAAPPPGPLDRISVRDHIVEVDIGAFQAERGITQRVAFNVVVEVRPVTAPLRDDVDQILSYDKVTEAIAAALAVERLNLLETLAERIAHLVLEAPQAVRCFVRVEKLDRGPGALGVEIVRQRTADATAAADADIPRPRVVFLGNDAVVSPHLSGWIDQLEKVGMPLVFCVGRGGAPAPAAVQPLAQRRIDLLAIEMNAWVLAARDRRCVVVGTRTELDWAMRQGQISVWAPSKLVLDAVDETPPGPRDGVALAGWCAKTFAARELLLIGADAAQANQIAAPVDLRCLPADRARLPL